MRILFGILLFCLIGLLYYYSVLQEEERKLRLSGEKLMRENRCLDSVWHHSVDTKTIPDWGVCKCK